MSIQHYINRVSETAIEVNSAEHANLAAIVTCLAVKTNFHIGHVKVHANVVKDAKSRIVAALLNAEMAKTTAYNRVDCATRVLATMREKYFEHVRVKEFQQANSEDAKETAITGFLADMNVEGLADANRFAKVGVALTQEMREELRTDDRAAKAKAAAEQVAADKLAKLEQQLQELRDAATATPAQAAATAQAAGIPWRRTSLATIPTLNR